MNLAKKILSPETEYTDNTFVFIQHKNYAKNAAKRGLELYDYTAKAAPNRVAFFVKRER